MWPAIITPAEREQVLARFTARRSSGRRAPRRFLLSGLLRCGRCDTPLYTSTQHVPPKVGSDEVRRVRRYVCSSGPAHGGCG
ncbi:zinc ribbon domain-containing protein, partial [Mycobacterium kansasii]